MVTVVVVLGNVDPAVSLKRVDRAIEEFRNLPNDNESKFILLSGGSPNEAPRSEASYMLDMCRARGIDDMFLMVEGCSKNTVENLLYTRKLISIFNEVPQLVICTSTFHIGRVIILTKLYFPGYKVRFIHTNEKTTEEEAEREGAILSNFLLGYIGKELAR